MEIKNTQQAEVTDSVSTKRASVQAEAIAESRRRFAKTGLAATGVLLTLASRSALGAGACKSPSGFVSGNVSQPGESALRGESDTYWRTHCTGWTAASPSDNFSTVFGSAPLGSNIIYGTLSGTYTYSLGGTALVPYTLLDVLSLQHLGYKADFTSNVSDTPNPKTNHFYDSLTCNATGYRSISLGGGTTIDLLAQCCVAALLNARAGKTPYLVESTIKEMFNACASGGFFHPTTGVDWTAAECITYIQSTWICS